MNVPFLMTTIKTIHEVKGRYPGKKELQKIIYLLQKRGVPQEYSYRFYFYGPYSDKLDEDIQCLAIRGDLEIEYGDTHLIKASDLDQKDRPDEETLRIINTTLSELQLISPKNLELMATIIYLIDNDYFDDLTEDKIVAGVCQIKPGKYSEDTIKQYYDLLVKNQYVVNSAK